MNNKSIRHMFCMGVIITTFASASFAQVTLKASINFPFVAQGGTMELGDYIVKPSTMSGGNHIYFFHNLNTGKSFMVTGTYPARLKENVPTTARLTFECLENVCNLKSIHDGTSRDYREMITPRKPKSTKQGEFIEVALNRNTRNHR